MNFNELSIEEEVRHITPFCHKWTETIFPNCNKEEICFLLKSLHEYDQYGIDPDDGKMNDRFLRIAFNYMKSDVEEIRKSLRQ